MSSDERFPYSRRVVVGAGGVGLVAAAAPVFAQSSKEAPSRKAVRPELLKASRTRETSTPSPRFAGRSSLGPGWRARWIRVRITARRPIAARVGSPAEKL